MTNDTEKQEQVLQHVLHRASQPLPPADAEARLMQRVRASSLATRPAPALVVAAPRKSRWSGFAWFGVPLAASLALGILFGSGNSLIDSYLPDSVVALISPSNGSELDVPMTLDDGDLSDGGLA